MMMMMRLMNIALLLNGQTLCILFAV